MCWLGAIRALAAAHVESARRRWRDLGHPATVHDAIDEILAGSGIDVDPATAAAARSALTADLRWRRLIEALAVPPREAELLALVTACELDPTLNRVLGYLDDTTAPAPPTPANATLLWGWPPGYQPGPASALARWRLAGPAGPWQRTTAWTVDGGIAAFLAGDSGWVGFDAVVATPDVAELDCLHPDLLADMLARLTCLGAGDCEVELVGPAGSGRRTLLAQLALAAGREPVLLQGDDRTRAVRAARLLGALPVLADDDAAAGNAGPAADLGAGLAFVARSRPAPAGPASIRRLSWMLPATTRVQRQRLWTARTSAPAPQALTDWDLSPADVAAAVGVAAAGSEAADAAIRQRLRTGAVRSMTALELPYDWDDLVITEPAAGQLRRLRNQVLLARDVLEGWEFSRLSPGIRGITALFAGPSGTGKTMAAQVLAAFARRGPVPGRPRPGRRQVHRRDGEAPGGGVRRVRAQPRDGVLRRGGRAVRPAHPGTDAHDRYANIEIDYLLQRHGHFRGVAVLATNRKADLDAAFLRRLRLVVDFLAPAPQERLRMWRRALPERTSTGESLTDALDHEWLAVAPRSDRRRDQVGRAERGVRGARRRGQRIGSGYVLDAARRELAKRGGVLRLESLRPGGGPMIRIERLQIDAGSDVAGRGRTAGRAGRRRVGPGVRCRSARGRRRYGSRVAGPAAGQATRRSRERDRRSDRGGPARGRGQADGRSTCKGAGRVPADRADPDPERHRLPVQPRDDDAHVDSVRP